MSLAQYRKKRDFLATEEPAGKVRKKIGRSYVIQKHDASHLHYDFRLELGGVLLSWAVPKGPSLDPRVKRLAMQTEDHPVEYGGFEGTIPKGSYGGGTVMVWDRGTWEPEGDAEKSYKAGRLTFQLHGEKLSGGWHLVRTSRGGDKKKAWLLFKASDSAARPGDASLLTEQANSAVTGRDLDAIAAEKAAKSRKKADKPKLRGKVAASALPQQVEVELASLVSEPPVGDGFIHEVKLDGYRIVARIDSGRVTLLTRGGEDWTERMPELAQELGKVPVKSAILDGELVALDDAGVSNFQLLQNSFGGKVDAPLAYYAFDLLFLNGVDLRGLDLLERKAALEKLCKARRKTGMLRYSEHVVGSGAEFLARAKELGLEGIVSKRIGSTYRAGRGKDWQKSKSSARQEFVIVGFTEPSGSRAHLGALLLATRKDGALVYAGRVGTGFNERSLKDLGARLAPLEIKTPKLENGPRGAEAREAHWVKPQLVAEVAYAAITHDGLLRHPTFKGLREDKPAREVVMEDATRARGIKKKEPEKMRRAKQAKPAPPIALTHPDKVLYPELGLTKRDLADYFELVASVMLPHVVNRPLTLLRCPEGRAKQCFFQKHPSDTLAEGLSRVTVKGAEGSAEYAVIDDARGLQALVQMGALELHIWGALATDSERPDRLVFDLDPDPALSFKDVVAGARELRALLDELGLRSWVKTTGGKGLHVTVPVTPEHGWDDVKAFSKRVAQELVNRAPARYIATMSKAKRSGKIFIDYLRNARGATFVAPYSSRAREGACVAMPIEWDDLSAKFRPQSCAVPSAAKWLDAHSAAPFASMLKSKQKLPSWS